MENFESILSSENVRIYKSGCWVKQYEILVKVPKDDASEEEMDKLSKLCSFFTSVGAVFVASVEEERGELWDLYLFTDKSYC